MFYQVFWHHPKSIEIPLCFDRISQIGGSPCRPCAKPLSFKVLLKIRKPRMSTISDGKKSKNIGLRSISHFGIFMAGHTSKRTLKTCHIPSLFQSWHINDSPHLKSALYTVVFDFLAAVLKREKDRGFLALQTDTHTDRQTEKLSGRARPLIA